MRIEQSLSVLCLAGLLLAGCASVPPAAPDKPISAAFADIGATELGLTISRAAARHPGQSGFVVLDTGLHAFVDRLALLDSAERAFDGQYFIWSGDRSGRYLAGRVLHAAERGVKARLLIDDLDVAGRDRALLMLDAHPNIEVRVFNPTETRKGLGKVLDFAGDFARLNRRMHSKSFVVDGSVAIVGGRNIADQYFDLHAAYNFRDRDLLAIGPIVPQISASFDSFWNSEWAYPITHVAGFSVDPEQLRQAQQSLLAETAEPPSFLSEYRPMPGNPHATLADDLRDATWAPAVLAVDELDSPREMGDTNRRMSGARQLRQFVDQAQNEILIESAYLVMGEEQLAALATVRSRGVRVKALTNSLVANDVVPNHAAYARRRPAMLEAGMALHELRPDAASCAQIIKRDKPCDDTRKLSLHAKTMVFDREALYVGSSNINLRSIYLNFEIGVVVFSPDLAKRVADDIERDMRPANSWRVSLGEDGELRWVASQSGLQGAWEQEPLVGFWKRLNAVLWSLLPLEKYF